MALTTSTIVSLALAAAAAGTSYVNTRNTNRRMDQEAARTIERQGRHQDEADSRVNAQVDELAASTSADERTKRMAEYMATIDRGRKKTNSGLDDSDAYGGAYSTSAKEAADRLKARGTERAGLMAGIDAPGMQRQGEAFDFGRLATDLGLVARNSRAEEWVSQIRRNGIRRSAGLDALSAGLSGAAGGVAGGAGAGAAGAASGAGGFSNNQLLAAMRWGMGGG